MIATDTQTTTCSGCGCTLYQYSTDAPSTSVWAMHWNGGTWCRSCGKRAHDQYKRERKAVIDAMPRCEYCNRRGKWKLGRPGHNGAALLCGRHVKQAKRHFATDILSALACGSLTGDDVRAVLDADNERKDGGR